MDFSNHNSMQILFSQLGLANDAPSMEQFVKSHHLAASQKIEEANFWSASQAMFIKEAREQAGDWAEVVDVLDSELHQ